MANLVRMTGSRSAVQRYVYDLSSVYGTDWWLDDPDFALANDPEIYDKLERDPIIYQAIQLRTLSVTGTEWHLDPPSDRKEDVAAAGLMEEILSEIRDFTQSRTQLFRAALLGGRGYAWIKGRRRAASFGDGRPLRWWVPKRLAATDKRRFVYRVDRPQAGKTFRQVLQHWAITAREWRDVQVHERKALVELIYQNREDQLGHGQGLSVPIYLYFRAKGLAWRHLQQAGELWGLGGIVVAKVDEDRPASTGKTNEDQRDDWLDTIDKMRSRHALVFGKSDEVDVLSPAGEGVRIPMETLEYCDKALYRLITGSLRPGGMDTDTGARAQAEVEENTTDVLTKYDRAHMDETMTRSLVTCVWELNRPQLRTLGLGRATMPRFASSLEQRENPAQNVTVISQALAAGIPLRKEDVYRKLDMSPPAPEDAVFEGQKQGVPGGAPGLPFRWEAEGMFPVRHDPATGEFLPEGESGGAKKSKKGSPGSQLEASVREALVGLGVQSSDLPPVDATDIEVGDLSGDDVHSRAVVTWRNEKGLKQHGYTPEFHAANAAKKWARVEQLEPTVGALRERLRLSIGSGEVGTAQHEGATVAAVIAETGLRPGSAASAKGLEHYGVSTLRGEHVSISGGVASITFTGKAAEHNVATVEDPATVASLAAYKERAGDGSLFGGAALGAARRLVPTKLKDLRTVVGTQEGRRATRDVHPPPPLDSDPRKARKQVRAAVKAISERVAKKLNNTPAVARSSYIHPKVWEEWADRAGIPREALA